MRPLKQVSFCVPPHGTGVIPSHGEESRRFSLHGVDVRLVLASAFS